MIHKFIDNLFCMDKSISRVVKFGFIFSMIICIASVILFYFYNSLSLNYIYHELSLGLFKTGIMFGISFFICGIATNTIRKE